MSDQTLRSQLIRLAHQKPAKSAERRALLELLASDRQARLQVWVDISEYDVAFWVQYPCHGRTHHVVSAVQDAEKIIAMAMKHFRSGLDRSDFQFDQTDIFAEPVSGSNSKREFWSSGRFRARGGAWDEEAQSQLASFANKYVMGFKVQPWR